MRYISQSLRPHSTRPGQLGLLSALLVGVMLLFSSCNGLSTASTTGQVNSLLLQKPAVVGGLLKAQGQLQLETFQLWIGLMQQYQGQTATYRQELANDLHLLSVAKTDKAYEASLQTLNQHVMSIRIPALKNESSHLAQQLTQTTSNWSTAHTFHDAYNGTTYHMAYEYGPDGVGGSVQDELSSAKTLSDYQQAVEDASTFLTNLQAYQNNASDTTPWDKSHQTDIQLMQHYQALGQKVVVISLSEQALRVYNKGALVKAFHVTTGRPEKPSLPGFWSIESKQAPTIFKSDEPPGSPYWYPDTPINYAMLYHDGGYFIHDSWWRSDYGPNTQFPHVDSSGDSFSFDGSHGCVNVSTPNAAWLYSYVDVNTHVLIY